MSEKYLVGFTIFDTFLEACYFALERHQESGEARIFVLFDDVQEVCAIVTYNQIFARSRALLCHWDDEQLRIRRRARINNHDQSTTTI